MTEKRYQSDWAKAKSRDLVKDMIQKTLLKFRKPEELSVLCLPGIDAEEIFQVYDALGIPRKNIVGVERESDIADALEQKDLGIKLFKGDLEDYINEQPIIDFDVVSLDYTGIVSLAQILTLRSISEKQKRNHFVLHSANSLRRDKQSNFLYYCGYTMGYSNESLENDLETVSNRINNYFRKFEMKEKLIPEKQISYTPLIESGFNCTTDINYDTVFRFILGRNYEKMIKYCEDKAEEITGMKLKIDPLNPAKSIKGTIWHPIVQPMIHNLMLDAISEHVKRFIITSKDFPEILMHAIQRAAKNSKFFIKRDIQCYSYISETSTPMLGDVYFLSFPEKEVNIAKEITDKVNYPDYFYIKDTATALELHALALKYSKASRKFIPDAKQLNLIENLNNRVFLGSSSKPVLTKGRALEEFRAGTTLDKIKEKYRGWDNKPLAQWKAHFTMGTYDANKPDYVTTGNDNVEKLSKLEALDLLSSGVPIKEIAEAFPASFSPTQLRALKAHLTMGTYESE